MTQLNPCDVISIIEEWNFYSRLLIPGYKPSSTDREAILTSRMGLRPELLRTLREPSRMLKASLDLHPRRAKSLWDSQARFLWSLLTLGGLEWLESLCLGRRWCQGLLLFRLVA